MPTPYCPLQGLGKGSYGFLVDRKKNLRSAFDPRLFFWLRLGKSVCIPYGTPSLIHTHNDRHYLLFIDVHAISESIVLTLLTVHPRNPMSALPTRRSAITHSLIKSPEHAIPPPPPKLHGRNQKTCGSSQLRLSHHRRIHAKLPN